MISGLTVGYVYSSALTSRLIEYYEAGAGPSHATTLVADGWVIDARLSGGVAMRPVSYLAGNRVRWFRIPAPDEAVKRAVAFLRGQIGQPYAWQDILAFATPAAFRRATGAKHPWMCSWLQGAAEVRGGILPSPPVDLERLTPFSLMLMNAARGAVEISGATF